MASIFKKLSWRTYAVIVPVLLLLGVVVWAGSESALQWAVQRAVNLSDGKLMVSQASGSLLGTIKVEKIRFETEEKRTELQRVVLTWSPGALFTGLIHVQTVDIAALHVVEKQPSTELPTLPESLHLPLRLKVDRLHIKETKTGGLKSQTLIGSVQAALKSHNDTYQIHALQLNTPWGQGEGEINLADHPPYTLSGKLDITQEQGAIRYQVRSQLKGHLPEIEIRADMSGATQAKLQAVLTPFKALPFKTLSLEAQAINPAQWNKAWPKAEMHVQLALDSDGEVMQGTLELNNMQAGAWDQQRLPVKTVRAQLLGDLDVLSIDALLLDLGAGGQLEGVGEYRKQALALDLATQNLNPRGLYSSAEKLRLAGSFHLAAQANQQALSGEVAQQGYRLQFDVNHQNGALIINKASVLAKGGTLDMTGQLQLAERRRFQAEGRLRAFNPAAFGDFPRANINAQFQAQGQLMPQWQAAMQFDIAESQYQNHKLHGKGKLNATAKRIWDSDVDVRVANNRLRAQGAFGATDDQLDIDIDAKDLSVLGAAFGGQLSAQGRVVGTLNAPAGSLQVRANQLRWTPAYRIQRLTADALIAKGWDGQMSATAEWAGLQLKDMVWDQGRLQAQGLRSKHEIVLAAKRPNIDLSTTLQGGWDDKTGWSGTLAQFENRGLYTVRLLAPAALRLAPDAMQLNEARLALPQGEVHIQHARYQQGKLSSSGSLRGVGIAPYRTLLPEADLYNTNLVFGGEWQLTAGDKVNGTLRLQRDSGDLVLRTTPQIALGLRQAELRAEIKDNRLDAVLEIQGEKLGQVRTQMQTQLSKRGEVWGIAGESPLQAKLRANMPSLAWLAPLADKTGNLVLDGQLLADLAASGTLAKPRLTGQIDGKQLKLEVPAQGVYLKQGKLDAVLAGQAIDIREFTLQSGQGSLTGKGRVDFADETANLSLRAERFELLARPGRHLVLSGQGKAAVVARKAQIEAQLRADEGRIELPKFDAPTLSKDVVVLGQQEKPKSKGVPYAIKATLAIDLGNKFLLKAMGLDAQLGGGVKLALDAGQEPRAAGSIRVVKGGYSAYGQRLDIERGILNFQGPLDNPGLNILALRKNLAVEAGVAITGTALAPRVTLASRPTVPDSEKLSWLVLGHGASSANSNEVAALQTAASALLAAGESVTMQSRIAHAAGLDEVNLRGGGTLEETVLTLGKRLSDKTYLSFEQGLTGASNLVKVNHQLSKRLSVRVQTGTESAADLFYTFSFD